jgi:NAD(P)-dependent dehydrogenase (short-subunit alcohol dehydrogenase family)
MAPENILLIGASGGLGKHLTTGLANAGYNLALHYHDNPDNIKLALQEIKNPGIKHKSYKADITSEKEVQEMINNVKRDFGTIDVLINNAGISLNGMSWKLNLDDWNKVISVNLTGPFLCTKHVLQIMKENNFGRIIYMSSVVSQIGVPGTAAYAATKAGLGGLCKTVSKEVVKNNITANVISLGYFEAGLLYQIPEDIRNQIKDTIPKKEFGSPKDVLECILYLCSENSGYITGQTININGGLY